MSKRHTFIFFQYFILLTIAISIFVLTPILHAAALSNPLGDGTGPTAIIIRVIKFVLGFVGVIALINFIIAGIQFLTSSGNPEKTGKATQNMLWTVIGLAILFTSGILVNVVLDIIGNTTK